MGVALPGLSAADVMAEAARAALADAGLAPSDVDGVFAASTQLPWATVELAEDLGIVPRHTDSTMIGGAAPRAHRGRPRVRGDRRRAVRGRGHRLRVDPAQRRPRVGVGPAARPVGGAVRPAAAG